MIPRLLQPLILMLALAAGLCLALCAAVHAESRSFVVETYRVPIDQWSDELPPVRIAVIADLHAKTWDGEQLDAIADTIRREAPDLIFMAGDFIEGVRHDKAMSHEEIARHLAPLSRVAPVYYVFGNHDLPNEWGKLFKAFEQNGFVFIEGKRLRLTLSQGRTMDLQGVPFFEGTGKHLEKLFAEPREASVPLVVLCHTPIGFDERALDLDLVVAGHTHGGQVCSTDGTPLFAVHGLPAERLRAGLKRSPNGRPIFVTRGLGWSRAPLRLNCRPEIAILELH